VPGVVDEMHKRLEVGVEHGVSREQIEAIVRRGGVSSETVLLEETKPAEFQVTLRTKHRPFAGKRAD